MLLFWRTRTWALQIGMLIPMPGLAWSDGSYTTSFPLMENPISEGAHWINGALAGLDWQNVRTIRGLACGTQTGSSGEYDDSTAVLTGTWGQSQTVQATVYSVNQNASVWEEVELRLRATITSHNITRYEINFRCLKQESAYMEIVRWNGGIGDFTRLAHYDGAQYGVANGDVVKATIIDSTITVYINNVRIGQASDSRAFTTGNPGIGFWLYGVGNTDNYGFSNFTARTTLFAN
jgi:hypothetical protein